MMMPPVGIEPTTSGLKVAYMQGKRCGVRGLAFVCWWTIDRGFLTALVLA